jgi:hypothetical protein
MLCNTKATLGLVFRRRARTSDSQSDIIIKIHPIIRIREENAIRHSIFSENTCIRRDPSAKETISRRASEPRLRVLLMPIASNGLPPGICAPANNTLSRTQRSSGWTHVKEEDWFAMGIRLAGVVINNISDLLPLTVDFSCNVPVMSVERWLGT